jgi:hypothetical protein
LLRRTVLKKVSFENKINWSDDLLHFLISFFQFKKNLTKKKCELKTNETFDEENDVDAVVVVAISVVVVVVDVVVAISVVVVDVVVAISVVVVDFVVDLGRESSILICME